jgi:L-ascorbate metabolism protein UlaG (beta-lactamase superfamily)
MKFFLYSTSVLLLITMASTAYLNLPKFGKAPSGDRLERIKQSPNYRDGAFQNLSHTPALSEEANYFGVMYEFLFKKSNRTSPADSIPSTKTDLIGLDPGEDVLVWFGHSSYYMQIDGVRMLVDPVFSGNASPFSFAAKAFKGTDRYGVEDFPDIDILFITHDHYDHLDYSTIVQFHPKVKQVICGLGVGEHLEHWGYAPEVITEQDWYDSLMLDSGFVVHSVPARHFSGRLFKRNQTLWTSFVLETPRLKLFIGGDSGYDTHFAEIGKTHGPFDLVILENGQYDKSWKYIHLLPDEILQAARDLNANRIMPVHSGKFSLGNHDWDEPLRLIAENNKAAGLHLVTPMIGSLVQLNDTTRTYARWWEGVE